MLLTSILMNRSSQRVVISGEIMYRDSVAPMHPRKKLEI